MSLENLRRFPKLCCDITLNNATANIKLKSNIQENELEFLDVLIYKGDNFEQNGIFDTKVYFKPTDSHALLHKHSFHPQHTFPGIIKSQLIRFARICKLEKDFNEATTTLFGALYRRGYSRRYLRKIKSQIKMQYYPPEEHTGMIPCNGKRCTFCRHVNKNKTIRVNSKPFRLYADGNCNTQAAIYIHCPPEEIYTA